MLFKELMSQGWYSVVRNRRRSTLTMLGIVWGLVCVVLLLAYGEGLARTIFAAFSNMSSGVLVLWPGRPACKPGASVRDAA